jgi:hypothetical protein
MNNTYNKNTGYGMFTFFLLFDLLQKLGIMTWILFKNDLNLTRLLFNLVGRQG